jgi:4-oxalocrotonate tautomerase
METILGKLHPASYIIIRDVAADSWGYEGSTQECRYIKGKSL